MQELTFQTNIYLCCHYYHLLMSHLCQIYLGCTATEIQHESITALVLHKSLLP